MGDVIVSIDAELGWGYHDVETPPTDRVEAGRSGWSRLLSLLDRFEIPATWAVVGHLFLENCDGEHAHHPAPSGWFARERGEWASRPDLRFGPDLVAAVRDAAVDHEIGSHTFSHVLFDERETPTELARSELAASRDVARDWGIEMESVAFPRNVVGHRGLLAEFGFSCYRGRSPVNRRDPGATRSALRLLRGTPVADDLLLVEPSRDEFGLVNVPASMYLYSFEGRARDVVAPLLGDPMVTQARRGIDLAASRDGCFHMWLHPNNLCREYTVERLRSILAYLADRRDDGDVTVETMGAVARRVRHESRRRVGSVSEGD